MKALNTPSLRLVALAAALSLTAVACGGSDSSSSATTAGSTPAAGADTTVAATDTTAAATETTGAAGTIDSLTVESGFSTGKSDLGTRYTSAGAVITNASGQAACGVTVQFSILDAKGTAIDTQTELLDVAAAGTTTPVVRSGLGGGKDTEPASLEVKVLEVASFAATCEASASSNGLTLATADAALATDGKYITGTLTNSTDTDVDKASVDCVLRGADKAIVGGEKKSVNDALAAGASVDFKIRVIWTPPTATSAECGATA